MTLPFTLPDWLPWWLPIVLFVPLALYLLALLVMPFAVLGVKSRLDAIELRLDEIQGEIRSLSLRMQEPASKRVDRGDGYISPPVSDRAAPSVTGARPPIPPAPLAAHTSSVRQNVPEPNPQRAEPKLNWPR